MLKPTNEQVYAALAKLKERAERLAADVDSTPRSPSDLRAAEERARAEMGEYTEGWKAQQFIECFDRQAEDPTMFVEALREEQEHVEAQLELAHAQLDAERDSFGFGSRASREKVQELEAHRRVIIEGPNQITPGLVAIPDSLVRRLAKRGIVPLPGCAHVFERRGGLRALEAQLSDLRREREGATAILARVLDLEAEPAPAG